MNAYIKTRRLLGLIAIGILIGAALGSGFVWGFQAGKEFPQVIVVTEANNILPNEPLTADFGTFWQAWDIINRKFLNNDDVTAQEKVYGAIEGLVQSLGDSNTEFFNPTDNKKFREDLRGSFGGIGAEIGIRDNQIIIVAPLKNTPASSAGLKAGDKILRVNDESTEGLAVHETVTKIRGPEGSNVILTIFRDGWEQPKDITITRAKITLPTLEYEMKGDLVHIQLLGFNANSIRLFYEAMLDALGKGAKGIVLDLRNNPGGFLDVAIDFAGWFLENDALIAKEVGIDIDREFRARGNAAFVDFPVVILINKGSASASEILAGALQQQRGIKLVGEKSFGKGTVQQIETLKDESSLKVTIAHWILPDGSILEEEGLEPDVAVELTDEDVENKRDPQLEKALEILRSQFASR